MPSKQPLGHTQVASTDRVATLVVPRGASHAVIAVQTAGIRFVDDGNDPGTGGTAEIQQLVIDATGGTFTVTYSGQTTIALAFNISGADFTTQMVALSNIEPGDVVVTGGPGSAGGGTPYILTWSKWLGNVAQITASATGLTGGAATATPSTTQGGVGPTRVGLLKAAGTEFAYSGNLNALKYTSAVAATPATLDISYYSHGGQF